MKQTTNSSIKTNTKKVKTANHVATSKNQVKTELKVIEKKDKIYALTSFICGLLFWVPLFNWILGPMAIIFGILALKYQRADPERYGGQAFAIIGIILGAISVIFTLIWIYFAVYYPDLVGFNNANFVRGTLKP